MLPRPQDTAPAPHQHTMPETGAAAAPAAAGSNADAETRHRHRSQAEGERAEPATQPASTGVLDKLFGKRLLQAGRYMMSHKSWMKTVPTENCDVLMTFAESTDDHTLLWLLNHIRLGIPELIIQIRHHKHTRVHAFFVTATYENLLRGAEEVGLRKPVKPEFGGGTRNFSCEEDYIYENIENEICFFSSQERQSIIRYWLENLRAKQGESLHNIHFLEGQPILPELAARGVIQQLFPLHEQRILSQLMKSWVQAVCEKQPLDDICDYFGVKIAMYFAWLGFYTTSMLYPAIIGFVLWMLTESDQTSRDICCVVFALFNVVWATLFLERWKRRGAELAYKWGTLDTPTESLEEPRPQFRGVKRLSPITGCEEFYYPPWKRMLFQYLVSLPVCLFCLCFVFLAMLICFELQEFVMGIKELPQVTRFIPKIILAITVTACDDVYRKIACWLNDRENYRLQSTFEKNLIIKIVLFQFVNSYLSLFYIGFYLKDMERLKEMLATLLIIRQFLQNVKEVLQPYLYERHKLGELTPKVLWDLLLSSVLKYGRMAAGKAQASPSEQASPGPGSGEKCLNGGCGVPDEEEEEEEGGEQERQSEDEVESLMDCGLKLRKVSFIEKAERKGVAMAMQLEDSFLEEGSPTMVEKGMDPASVFELCDDIDNGYLETKEAPGEILVAPLAPGGDAPVSLRQRKRGHSAEREESKTKRESWIDPPEETFSSRLTQAEVESCMKKYEDTFQDYQEMFIQFGYVVLFSSAFPLAAMCALINNIIEIRSDAFKLCTGLQRPFGQRVESIGQWQNVMEAMGFIAIVVNCYLISQCGQLQRLFPWLSPEMAIISIVILEHFAVLLKYIIHVAIPDIPSWVADEMAKLEYQRREAFKKHERQAQQHFQQQQRRKREEEERQRQAEHHARRERDKDEGRGTDSSVGEHHHDKGHKPRSGGGSDKPKRPSSLLATNNVMKLKQIIPLQSKFNSGTARSPQSPTGSSEPKLPGFLSFKFLKSPENKKEAAAAAAAAAAATVNERSHSPTKSFNPGKLFNFGKSEGGPCANGAQARPGGDGPPDKLPTKSDLNGAPEEMPSTDSEPAHGGESEPPGSKN
ncbi:anoctamin-8-like isoform X1 [Acipenser oxyrinchus oxyrinchus]|uniref:Anoctamin n=1 Tax=Acipenser oxyrinchus oxyrinchus TaxID=40147 RepID=A0AAD8FPR0_ACIOX|nr:anoctamin-8-like isoform X1 [Acipenser oxyrinchus oxyrinchus]